MTPTAAVCAACSERLPPGRARRYCTPRCRQAAYRRRQQPPPPTVHVPAARSRRDGTIYLCQQCDTRYLAEQWCPDCNQPCSRLGPGGPCPHCDEPVAITDLSEVITIA